MNSLFVDWYEAAGIRRNAEELKSRWDAVEQLGKVLDLEQCLKMINLVFQLPVVNNSFREDFGLKVQEHDATFNPRKGDLELCILAGSALYELIERTQGRLIDQVSLAVACVNCQGAIMWKLSIQRDLIRRALDTLSSRAVMGRLPDKLNFEKPGVHNLSAILKEAEAQWNPQPNSEKFRKPFEALNKAVKGLSENVARLTYELKIQREETEILWWLMGRWSQALDKPFSEIPLAVAALIAGSELALMTAIFPGPRSAPAVLAQVLEHAETAKAKAGQPHQKITIKEAVTTLTSVQSEALINQYKASIAPSMFPVHLALQKSQEFPKGKNWVQAYDSVSLLKSTKRVSALDLAMQTYQELQFISITKG
jgi:hypothetical protein